VWVHEPSLFSLAIVSTGRNRVKGPTGIRLPQRVNERNRFAVAYGNDPSSVETWESEG